MLSEFSEIDYWNYYDPRYPWGRYRSPLKFLERLHREIDASGQAFSAAGFSDDTIEDLLASGYIVTSGLVIDRYYGGLLTSSDLRSRIPIEGFRDELLYKEHSARVHHAKSLEDVTACIAKWQTATGRRLLFRGQTANYPLQRRRPNPGYQVLGFGEISLLPSVWRKLHQANPGAREDFVNLSLLEWSKVLYSAYDLKEIEARQAAALERGEWMYSAQDMEDSDDPVLHEFGKLRLDLVMGFEHDLNVPLETLLQHYGLLSPLLDLTTDLEVALFFASHKFESDPATGLPKIAFVGTNDRKAVIYVLRENVNEMSEHQHHRALERFQPERPNRQSCVIALCGSDALNLPAEFLFGIICLDFDDLPPSKYGVRDLFPGPEEDRFLAALQHGLQFPERVTDFSKCICVSRTIA
jgi:FRG domain